MSDVTLIKYSLRILHTSDLLLTISSLFKSIMLSFFFYIFVRYQGLDGFPESATPFCYITFILHEDAHAFRSHISDYVTLSSES